MRRHWIALGLTIPACASVPDKGAFDRTEMSAASQTDRRGLEEAVLMPACSAGAARPSPDAGPCWTSLAHRSAEHLRVAAEHRRRAAPIRAALPSLRDAEARACAGTSEYDREVSLFDHREDIVRIDDMWEGGKALRARRELGAVVAFRPLPGMSREWLQRVVDCHIARSAVLGGDVPWMPECPLALQNVHTRVIRTGDGFEVEIRSDDPATVREIRRRLHALVANQLTEPRVR